MPQFWLRFVRELESVREDVLNTHGQVVELELLYHTLHAQFVVNLVREETRGIQVPPPTPPTVTERDNPLTWIQALKTSISWC